AYVEIHNKMELNHTYIVHSPIEEDYLITIDEMMKENVLGEFIVPMEVATIGKQVVRIRTNKKIEPYSIIRLNR
ncbi:MAG: hypothetical protein J6Q86_03305, partial [Methanobrevibacter sp.]|nr:hypothetical protein [Methanobrevibacter sp.]